MGCGRREDGTSVRRPRSDAELLAASSEDAKAFGEFYDRHVAAIVAFFHRRVYDPELVLDLTAETFAGALASVRRFSVDAGEPRAWLFAIARHKLADAIRTRRVDDEVRRRLAMEPVVLDDEGVAIIERMASRGLLELVADLPDSQREAVVAHYLEGRAYDEIAAELDLSESVVRKRASRGLRALRRAIMRRAGS